MKKIVEYVQKFKNNPKLIVALGLIGILLIFLSTAIPESSDTKETKESITAQEYADSLEKSLSDQISEVVGGDVNVMITLESGVEYVYASQVKNDESDVKDSDSNSSSKSQIDKKSENSYILYEDENGNEIPLVVTEIMPSIKGVVVSCKNGENQAIESVVSGIVTTALNISDSRVCVVGSDLN